MLHIIGLGLDDGEITGKGMQALEEADRALAEFYTNTETVDLENLQEESGTEIEKLDREQVEREDRIIEESQNSEIAFLVSGDPLTATTHYDIKHRAEKEGIKTEVYHAPSIFTSIAETGLNVYKFGRTVTLPREASPESVVNHIAQNDQIGLHSLVLLDINYPADQAAEKMIDLDESLAEREAIVFERANNESQEITALKLRDAVSKEFGSTPHCIIIIGEKSHKEEEFLEAWR